MRRTKPVAAPMVARVYLRVSTDAQDLERQEAITTAAKAAGYYVAGIYREKASGARADRPELLRMIGDLQPGEVVIAEKIDGTVAKLAMRQPFVLFKGLTFQKLCL
ncbi:recombinase family protein, partial [Klebsiella pneumoniae]